MQGASFDDLLTDWQASKAPAAAPVKPCKIEPEWTAADDFEISKFHELKDRTGRALIIHHLRQTHSAKKIALKAGISDRDVARKTNAVNIYHASERMRQIVCLGSSYGEETSPNELRNILIPWGRYETTIGIMSMTKNSLDALCDRAAALA
jgi:hypothetical protein